MFKCFNSKVTGNGGTEPIPPKNTLKGRCEGHLAATLATPVSPGWNKLPCWVTPCSPPLSLLLPHVCSSAVCILCGRGWPSPTFFG